MNTTRNISGAYEEWASLPDFERLSKVVRYEAETGFFYWRRSVGKTRQSEGKRQEGALAGCLSHGYVTLKIDGRNYRAHRVAWLLMHGRWPIYTIDHVDGERSNNRIGNLRDVPTSVNLENLRRAKSHNRTGLLGVASQSGSHTFTARIVVNGKRVHLGSFRTKEEAHVAYVTAKRQLHLGCSI